jgi:predicted cupin superfamily sugar epimerase
MTAEAALPEWARGLGLVPHPEGGWYAETYRHARSVDSPSGERALATGILFLLLGDERSAWHRVRSDELWFHHRGAPLELMLGGSDPAGPSEETMRRLVLGSDLAAGELAQALVPGDIWQSARPLTDEPVLVSCVVSPGFDFADFTLLG